jgi:hypothetical protein
MVTSELRAVRCGRGYANGISLRDAGRIWALREKFGKVPLDPQIIGNREGLWQYVQCEC